MEKSAVTEFFLKYFKEKCISIEEISEKTGIDVLKFSGSYRQMLTATEFLELCVYLGITPEMVREGIKESDSE